MDYPDTTGKPEAVEFLGRKYVRMGGRRNYYLSQSTSNKGRIGARGLHVSIWEHANGKSVPSGHVVHHIDGNPFNNSPSNLECLTTKEHGKHQKWEGAARERQINHLNRIRHLASEWHRSDEGRAWHSENAKGPNKKVTRECLWCEKRFEARQSTAKYCRNQCGYEHRRSLGHYDVVRQCEFCGKSFETVVPINPSRARRFCSRKCAVAKR